MNYEIHIQDTENLEDILILEYAHRNSISLNWMGGDDKTQPIVGSELNFTLEVLDGADATFDQYFTSDEQKWLVTKVISSDQKEPEWAARAGEVVWRGYLLPESYSEPWENPLFYVEFSAVDGLGLLKGKTLPKDFYSQEKSVIEVISECLKLTGIDFDIFLSPAITNYHEKLWHKIYIDTRKYHDDKLPSAYEILEDIISSMRCQLFQSEGRWYIEGINKRHLGEAVFYRYDISGAYKGAFTVTKNKKVVHWSPGTMITMMAPLKEVEITHEAEQLKLPEEIVQEIDRDWKAQPGVPDFIYPQHWTYPGEYKPVMKAPDYYLELPNKFDNENYPKISLKEKLYVLRGWRIKFEIEVEIVPTDNLYSFQIDEHIDGDWMNIIFYEVYLNTRRVASNILLQSFPELTLKFDRNLKASASFEFVAEENGFLDIELWGPLGYKSTNQVEAVKVRKLVLEKYEQEKDFVYTEIIEEKSSRTKDIDLAFADDVSGLSNCFYLERLRDYKDESFLVPVPIINSYVYNGNNYAVVNLAGANLIEQFIDSVMYITRINILKNLEVIYNFNGGEEMVVKSDQPLSGTLYVKVKEFKDPQIDRDKWLEWSDDIYGVEKKRYAQVVAEIESKLFATPHYVIEGTAQAPVKYNDLIQFKYKGENKFFTVTNCEWNPDNNQSFLTLVEGVYSGSSLGNIPPYIYAGPDLVLSDGETSGQITEAVATDPNGYIDSLVWEIIEGEGGNISNPNSLNPMVTGLIGDEYTLRLTGVDNEGFSASDTMRWIRVSGYEIIITKSLEDNGPEWQTVKYNIATSPSIPQGDQLVLTFDASIELRGVDGLRIVNIDVNKTTGGQEQLIFSIGSGSKFVKETEYSDPGTLTISAGEEASLTFRSRWNPLAPSSEVDFNFVIREVTFLSEKGIVTNLPVRQEYNHTR